MKEHLSASVEAGTVQKLQELAKGQRKVGEYLTDVVELLWAQHSSGDDETKRKDAGANSQWRADLEAEIAAQDAAIVEMAKRMERQNKELSYFRSVIESGVLLEGYSIEEYRTLRKSFRSSVDTITHTEAHHNDHHND